MIRFNVKAGVLTPVLPADATEDEKAVAGQIAQRFNGIQAGDTNYKQLMESLNQSLQGNYTNPNDYIDQQTVQELENFYATASGISQWDPTKQGADLLPLMPSFIQSKYQMKLLAGIMHLLLFLLVDKRLLTLISQRSTLI